MNTLTAVGHRGDPYRVRENTLASVRSAFARGADAVEVDVRLTRDGVPVLLHDETLQRLWGHDVRLDAVTAAQLKELAQGGIPTLREALTAAGAGRLMLDLPGATAETVRTVVGLVRECGARERAYYCAGPDTMLAVRAADPGAEIALTWTTLSPPRRVLIDAVAPAGSTTASGSSTGSSRTPCTGTGCWCRRGRRTPSGRCAPWSRRAWTPSPRTGWTP